MRTARRRFVTGVFVPALVWTTCFVGRPAAEESANATRTETTTANALAEIMAIPNRFDRDATLYRLVSDADRQRIEALLAALADEPGAPRKDDVARVLYERFVSLERSEAVAHALRNYPKPQILVTVFRAWAHVDLEAAVARASELSMVMKQDAARAILDLDLSASERASIAEWLDTRPNLVEIEQAVPPRVAEPYDQALARIAAVDDVRARYREIASLAATWAAEDPAGALAAILDWGGDKDLKGLWLGRVMGAWSDQDPRAAVDWLLTRDLEEVASLVGPAFAALAKTDLAEAEALVEALEGSAGLEAQLAVLAVMLEEGELDLALAAFDEMDPAYRQRYALGVGRRLAREDPEWAVAWTMELDEPIRSNTLGFVLAGIQESDPELARQLTAEVDDTSMRIQAASVLATRAEPSDALRWVTTLGSEAETAPLVARVFAVWSARDSAAAIEAVMEYPSGLVRDQALVAMVSSRLRLFDTASAERLLNAIDSPTERSKAAAELRAYRSNTEP